MSYNIFVEKFIHPLIIYVLFGTLISYIIAKLLVRFPIYRDSRFRAIVFGLPFAVPLVAYFLYKPFMVVGCFLYGQPLGTLNDWLCFAGTALAVIFTPLFLLVTVLAVVKAGLSIYASRRIVRKYNYALPEDYPGLFSVIESLCAKSSINVPRIIVTKDRFARSFTMGYRMPVIVLSEGLLNALDKDETETVLAHELGHITRGDSFLTWITVFLRDLMFFTPIVFWIFRDLSAEKENASDDFAVKLTGKPMAFAQALIKVWKLSPRTLFDNILLDNFMPHPNFIGQAGVLEHRITRILNDEHQEFTQAWSSYAAVAVVLILSVSALYLFC